MKNVTWDFAGDRVIVTGAATGIGLGIATAFGSAGATVVLLDRDAATLAEAVETVRGAGAADVLAVVADLTDADEIRRAGAEVKERVGGVDVVVNNAGVGAARNLAELSDAELDLNLDVNLRATILVTREFIGGMLERGRGAIVNIASQAGKTGFPGISHYSASKAGVLGFTKSLAAEVAPNVRVNSVSPGAVLTGMMENNIRKIQEETGKSREEASRQWTDFIPLKRWQQPSDIANAVLFLASDAASEITGESMNVSGGQTMS